MRWRGDAWGPPSSRRRRTGAGTGRGQTAAVGAGQPGCRGSRKDGSRLLPRVKSRVLPCGPGAATGFRRPGAAGPGPGRRMPDVPPGGPRPVEIRQARGSRRIHPLGAARRCHQAGLIPGSPGSRRIRCRAAPVRVRSDAISRHGHPGGQGRDGERLARPWNLDGRERGRLPAGRTGPLTSAGLAGPGALAGGAGKDLGRPRRTRPGATPPGPAWPTAPCSLTEPGRTSERPPPPGQGTGRPTGVGRPARAGREARTRRGEIRSGTAAARRPCCRSTAGCRSRSSARRASRCAAPRWPARSPPARRCRSC